MRPYYVTTAIAYPNGAPHVGHAYEYIATDAIARFKRLDGFDVRFLTGTDEHGQKVAEAAAAAGVPTAELARRNSDVFQRMQEALNISFDRFIRTTDADHHEASKEIWRRMDGRRRHLPGHLLRVVLGARRAVSSPNRRPTVVDGTRIADRNRHPGDLDREGADLLLPAFGVRRQAAGPLRGQPGLHRARRAPQRGGQLRLRRPDAISRSREPRSTGACRCPGTPTTSCTSGSTR